MLKILKEHKNPEILVMTPLGPDRKISTETRTSIKRNDIPFTWASFEGDGKHAANVQSGLEAYLAKYRTLPKFFQIIDDDIILGRHMLDRLHSKIIDTPQMIAFVFCPFSYRGHINVSFPAQVYDINKLLTNNYISSNSLYKSEVLMSVGGFVTEYKYHRLSDWAMWLGLFRQGYAGVLCDTTSFVAISKPTDISAGSIEEYETTRNLIINDFARPLV